jgi:hypothetical protein
MIRREFWTTILAYNLIRTTIASAASLHDKKPRQISFVSACQYVLANWQRSGGEFGDDAWLANCLKMLEQISQCKVGHRPGRLEPRVVKRRRDQYMLMTQPRSTLRRRLRTGDNCFE